MDSHAPWTKLSICLDHATQNLALPLCPVNRPTLYCPAFFAHNVWPAERVHALLALLLSRGELLPHRPGVAAAAVDAVVVHYRDYARLRQIKQTPGDHLVAGGGVTCLELQKIVGAARSVRGQPACRNKQMVSKQIGERFAGKGGCLLRFDAEPGQQRGLEMLADFMSHGPLMPLHGRFR